MKKKIGEGQVFHFSNATNEGAIEHVQEVGSIIDSNKRLQQEDHALKDEFRLCARIPLVVYYEWKQKFGIDAQKKEDWPAVKKLLNSPEYKYLKTTQRRI
tara:strand:- start:229 stop:528 length:300 start_codon:yes stop_codon:yes gene_type:complete